MVWKKLAILKGIESRGVVLKHALHVKTQKGIELLFHYFKKLKLYNVLLLKTKRSSKVVVKGEQTSF